MYLYTVFFMYTVMKTANKGWLFYKCQNFDLTPSADFKNIFFEHPIYI